MRFPRRPNCKAQRPLTEKWEAEDEGGPLRSVQGTMRPSIRKPEPGVWGLPPALGPGLTHRLTPSGGRFSKRFLTIGRAKVRIPEPCQTGPDGESLEGQGCRCARAESPATPTALTPMPEPTRR